MRIWRIADIANPEVRGWHEVFERTVDREVGKYGWRIIAHHLIMLGVDDPTIPPDDLEQRDPVLRYSREHRAELNEIARGIILAAHPRALEMLEVYFVGQKGSRSTNDALAPECYDAWMEWAKKDFFRLRA